MPSEHRNIIEGLVQRMSEKLDNAIASINQSVDGKLEHISQSVDDKLQAGISSLQQTMEKRLGDSRAPVKGRRRPHSRPRQAAPSPLNGPGQKW